MEFDLLIPIAVVALATIILVTRIKVIHQNERMAVVILGRYMKLLDPGLKIKFSGPETRWIRLSLGQLGRYVGDGIAEFDGAALPIKFEKTPKQGVKIERFDTNDIWATPCNIIVIRCEKCGHMNEIPA